MSRSVQLPISGRLGQAGSVSTIQTPLPGGTVPSANTINTTLQVQGAYAGSVPSAGKPGPVLALSLEDALRRGLQYNLGTVGLQNSVRQALGQRRVALSTMLPYVAGDLLVTEQQTNLAALGFTGFPGIPTIVGPFHYVDLRAGVSQSVFDLTRLNNYRAARENVRSTELSAEDARDLVALAVSGTYLQVIALGARVDSVRAQVTTAQATYQQSLDRFNAGVVPRIDVTRSQVSLQIGEQRLTVAENDLAKQRLALARVIGLPPGQDFTLTDTLPYAPLTGITLDQALARAYGNRADLKSAESRVRAAELARKAAVAERYPTVEVSGDYGVLGPSPTNSHGTFGVTGAVRFPIFQGGRVRGEIEQADAALQQRRAEYQDMRGQVDAEVRRAFLDLNAAASQVAVAESSRKLAADTLAQARDRFAAGVTDTLEVVQAQEQVAVAEQDYIGALYAHNLAKASLARAMGQAAGNIRQFLGRP
jgi:outer membrane protein TolC